MKKNVGIAVFLLSAFLIGGCGEKNSTQQQNKNTLSENAAEASQEVPVQTGDLTDGTYLAEFKTDSGMFHVSEACDGKGTLTVADGKMTIHVSLASKNIVNLYPGLAEDAKKEGAELLEPTEDTVTYSDGMTEEVYGFDVPVPALGTEFDLALIGTKGKWYDHKATVSNPVAVEGESKDSAPTDDEEGKKDSAPTGDEGKANTGVWEDGTYSVEVTFEGGSGRAEILSPATATVKDGKITAAVQWSSPNYDYMIVDEEKYLPVSTDDGSMFEFPISEMDKPIDIIGDTVAMSKPHEVEYTLTFHSDTMKKE